MRLAFAVILSLLVGHVVVQPVTIMSYNCENLFDTIHDSTFDDFEFLPTGTHHWSRWRMYQKLRGINQVIMAADTLRPVDIVCLEEVENDTALTYLTRRTALNSIAYNYIMTHSADTRGVDVAIIYSPFTTRLLHHHPIRAVTSQPTRDILYASFLVHGADTLDIYALHLPSRLGGREATRNRTSVLDALLLSVDSLRHVRHTPNIVVLGDFNDHPRSRLIRRQFSSFVNLADMKQKTAPHYSVRGGQQSKNGNLVRGTYKYQGAWDCIDQIIISQPLLPLLRSAEIIAPPFLLEPDERYGGVKPRRTFIGYSYNGGTSDHLPVMVRFDITR